MQQQFKLYMTMKIQTLFEDEGSTFRNITINYTNYISNNVLPKDDMAKKFPRPNGSK